MDADKSQEILRTLMDSARLTGDNEAFMRYKNSLENKSNASMVMSDPWESVVTDTNQHIANNQKESADAQKDAAKEKEQVAKATLRTQIEEEELTREQKKLVKDKKIETKAKTNADRSESTAAKLKGPLADRYARGKGAIGNAVANSFFVQIPKFFLHILKDIIKYGIIFAIFIIILGFLGIKLYAAAAPNCVQYTDESLGGSDRIINAFKNSEFRSCIYSNVWAQITNFGRKLSVTEYAMKFLDQQIYSATGSYYFSEVDQNSKEPMGLFIEDINFKQQYSNDEPMEFNGKIKIKTVGNKVSGIVTCDINNKIFDRLYPPNGAFFVDDTKTESLGCTFDENQFEPGNKVFTYSVQFDYQTFAYVLPKFIKYSIISNMSSEQRAQLEKTAKKKTLSTTNAPAKIGGLIGNDDTKIVIIDDRDDETNNKPIKLGITLHSDNTGGWDKGRIHEVKELVIVLPKAFTLSPDLRENTREDISGHDLNTPDSEALANDPISATSHNSITACGGYVFQEVQCSPELNKEFGYENEQQLQICNSKEKVYRLDQSGNNKNMMDIETTKTLNCWLQPDFKQIFKDTTNSESQEVGINVLPIKIIINYRYDVSIIRSITIVGSSSRNKKLFRSDCSSIDDYDPAHSADYQISNDILTIYSQEFQIPTRRYAKLNLPSGYQQVQMEALVAAIMYRFSGMEVVYQKDDNCKSNAEITDCNNNGMIDFITGCKYNLQVYDNFRDSPSKDIQCLTGTLQNLLNKHEDIDIALTEYYKTRAIYNGREITSNDYKTWLNILCMPEES